MKQKILTSIIMLLVFIGCVEPQVETKENIEKKEQKTFIWDTNTTIIIPKTEYDKIMQEYIQKNYSKQVKTYKWKQKQKKIRKAKRLRRVKKLKRQQALKLKREKEELKRVKELKRIKRLRKEEKLKKQAKLKRVQKIKLQRKIKNNTVVINKLMWQNNKKTKIIIKDWKSSKQYCKSLLLGNFSNWRLATQDELKELYNNKEKLKYIKSSYYWSSDTVQEYKIQEWNVYAFNINFSDGYINYTNKKKYNYTICVRNIQ